MKERLTVLTFEIFVGCSFVGCGERGGGKEEGALFISVLAFCVRLWSIRSPRGSIKKRKFAFFSKVAQTLLLVSCGRGNRLFWRERKAEHRTESFPGSRLSPSQEHRPVYSHRAVKNNKYLYIPSLGFLVSILHLSTVVAADW